MRSHFVQRGRMFWSRICASGKSEDCTWQVLQYSPLFLPLFLRLLLSICSSCFTPHLSVSYSPRLVAINSRGRLHRILHLRIPKLFNAILIATPTLCNLSYIAILPTTTQQRCFDRPLSSLLPSWHPPPAPLLLQQDKLSKSSN